MGQSSSTQREREAFAHRDSRRFSQLVQMRDTSFAAQDRHSISRDRDPNNRPETSMSMPSLNPHTRQIRTAPPYATFRRRISARLTTTTTGQSGIGRRSASRGEVLYEQEERPLVSMEDLRMRDAPITHITASPMPRRTSVLSRLGSRLLPRYAVTGPSSTDGDGSSDRPSLRRRLSNTSPFRSVVTPESDERHRYSVFGSLSTGTLNSSRSTSQRHTMPISRPIPLTADGSIPPSGLSIGSLQSIIPETSSSSSQQRSSSTLAPNSLRNSRMSRVRRSISSLESLFSNSPNQMPNNTHLQTSPRRPMRATIADETDYLLPPLNVTNTSLDLDDPAIGTYDGGENQNPEISSPSPEAADRSSSWTQRWSDRTPTRRESRRVPNLLRGRSSRIIRRDDEAPLSRILQLAAAAIAAQLSGVPDGITDMEPMSDDSLDGSLNSFMESMNNAAGTAAASNEAPHALATLPPLNFLRVFRFVNSPSEVRQDNIRVSRQLLGRSSAAETSNEGEGSSDGRTVTLVVVGVRSVPSASIAREDPDGNLDTLINLPIVPPASLRTGTTGGGGGLLRHANGRSRFQHRRRASMGGVNPFPANYDSQRHQRTQAASRSVSGDTTPVATAVAPMIVSESPPGPHPPPSTPADPGLSAQPSGATTPNRRPSSASAVQNPQGAHHDNVLERLNETHEAQNLTNDAYHAVRQRRRSDSEFARHRDLGAGAARRNGVVEPDDTVPQGRSWLIYVVGTNLSEDHPAFATPSLFTDVRVV
ncbi:hypothetical protein MMC26_003840 [Xylographa opegraphella]|nr:hypothetical protein [Xylographa opegraphella]